ncbi:MAG: hypothetical protein AAGF90_16070 [Pseudomonadota bacterium]
MRAFLIGLLGLFVACAAAAGERSAALGLAADAAKGRLWEHQATLPSLKTRATAMAMRTDLGHVVGVLTGDRREMNLPLTLGHVDLVRHGGFWLDDRVVGGALALPATRIGGRAFRDLSIFAGFDEVTTSAFSSAGAAEEAKATIAGLSGATTLAGGAMEFGAAYVLDRRDASSDLSYANMAMSYRRPLAPGVVNTTRVIGNFGAASPDGEGRRLGLMALSENAVNLTSRERAYLNLWWARGGAQPVARSRAAGGLLRHVGSGFRPLRIKGLRPLDARARDGAGGALGLRRIVEQGHVAAVEAAAILPEEAGASAGHYALSAEYAVRLDPGLSLGARAGYVARGAEDARFGAKVEVSFAF